jgi:Transposase
MGSSPCIVTASAAHGKRPCAHAIWRRNTGRPKVRCAATCLGGIIKGYHEGIKSTRRPVPFEKSRDQVESSETVVILLLAVPWMPRTSSAGQGLARERESHGIPLVRSCASSTRAGPSDPYGRSSEREILARNERELWALSCRMPWMPNARSSPCHMSGLWVLIGAHGSIRSLGSTRDRRRVGERVVDHAGASLARLADWLWTVSAGQPQRVAVAIEVPRGAIVEGLLDRGFHLFAMNPKQLDRFRDRHSAAGAKDDRRDACVLADSLRTARPSLRRVHLGAPQL